MGVDLADSAAKGDEALVGTYVGASAQNTVGGGTGANILVGGSYLVVELKPLSVQQRTGINVAAGVAEIELHFVR
jgi:hypothetical protein